MNNRMKKKTSTNSKKSSFLYPVDFSHSRYGKKIIKKTEIDHFNDTL